VSSLRLHGPLIDGSLTPVLPPLCALHLRNRSSIGPDGPEPRILSDNKLPLRILSVGYTSTADGCPPLAPAGQQEQRAIASDPLPGMPGRCGVRLEPCRDVAATVDPHRPCQARDSRYHRNVERADWFRTATRFASGDAPEKPRRISLAPSTPREQSPKNVQHRRELPAHRACCHPRCGTAC
jgi:hypothetical protein